MHSAETDISYYIILSEVLFWCIGSWYCRLGLHYYWSFYISS